MTGIKAIAGAPPMTGAESTRGKPLVALVVVMGAWVAMRSLFWDAPAFSQLVVPRMAALTQEEVSPVAESADVSGNLVLPGPQSYPDEGYYTYGPGFVEPYSPWLRGPPAGYREDLRQARQRAAWRAAGAPEDYAGEAPGWRLGDGFAMAPFGQEPVAQAQAGPVPVRIAIAHQMMWMAAVSRMPLPASLFENRSADGLPWQGPQGRDSARRLSADGWLLLRKGGNVSLASGVAPATYGASQFGAVLRYRIAPTSRLRPTAYLRTTAALNGSREKEAALGISARPLPRLPVAVAAELRANDQRGSTQLRPAVVAWTELAPIELPYGARAEVYAQGGYVAGKFKSPFVDGQVRIDRTMAKLGGKEVRAGGGAWAGAQKGASRVDVGPTASVGVPISDTASARVGVDWRFRVGGNAEPESGPALTLSAGF